jgi:hypothetical protein
METAPKSLVDKTMRLCRVMHAAECICTQIQVRRVVLHPFLKGVCMQLSHSSDLLTAVELADRLGLRPGTILAWHRRGKIPARKLSHKVLRFNLGDVLTALESQRPPIGREVSHEG